MVIHVVIDKDCRTVRLCGDHINEPNGVVLRECHSHEDAQAYATGAANALARSAPATAPAGGELAECESTQLVWLAGVYPAELTAEESAAWHEFCIEHPQYVAMRRASAVAEYRLRHGVEQLYLDACDELYAAGRAMYGVAKAWHEALRELKAADEGEADLESALRRIGAERPAPGSVWRHRKGGEYSVVCCAVRESDMTPLVVYRDRSRADHVWARPLAEFMDGRFEVANE